MKIEFDKALLWLVPYLYLVSVMYYWGYWSVFEIDAFSYYEVSDLVKGVTAPINVPITLMSIIFSFLVIVFAFARLLSAKIDEVKGGLRITLLIILFIFTIVAPLSIKQLFHYLDSSRNIPVIDNYNYHIGFTLVLVGVVPLIILLIIMAYYFKSIKKEEIPRFEKFMLGFVITASLCMLPGQCYVEGKESALRIVQNKKYNYVIKDSLAVPNKTIYKYLGKAGEHHILLAQDNSRYVVISTEKLDPVVVERFVINDERSIRRLNKYRKELAVPVSKKGLLQHLAPSAALSPQQHVQPK